MAKKTDNQIKQEINEALLNDLLLVYSTAEQEMLAKVAKRVAKGITEVGWNELKAEDVSALRQEISAVLKSPSKKAKTIMGTSILKSYKFGVNSVEHEAGLPITSMKDLNIPVALQNLLLANYDLIDNANSNILRKVDDAYRSYMAESAAMLLAGTETRQQASQNMMNKLAAKGITTFTDKAGRTWDLGSYTEMAMRTASAHAALQGRIDTQVSLGNDLMQISRIGTTCPICAPWQGVVISISGKTPGYKTVDDARAAGVFHPNCRHTMVMWDVELDGEGQKELNGPQDIAQATFRYDLTQQQRANERMIRYWRGRKAAAITPAQKFKAQDKLDSWILKNIMFCEEHGLRRLPQREGLRNPKSKDAKFMDWFGKHLMGYTDDDLAKIILDEATLKQMLKDKSETLTTLYKKYLGDNPSQDFKASGEATLTYAQWLKAKVMELTVDAPDPNEVTYITLPPKLTEAELKAAKKDKSLTEIYKHFISATPSQDYKTNYTGPLTYAQWLKAQVADLTMEHVVPSNYVPQGQLEIEVLASTEPKPKAVDFNALSSKAKEMVIKLKDKGVTDKDAVYAAFLHSIGYGDYSKASKTALENIDLEDIVWGDDTVFDVYAQFKEDIKAKGYSSYMHFIVAEADNLFTPEEVEKLYTMYAKATGKQVTAAQPTTPTFEGAIKTMYDAAYAKIKSMDGMFEIPSIENVVKNAEFADPALQAEMNKKGQAAVVKGGVIYFNPYSQGLITEHDVLHELGHLMTKHGLKATTSKYTTEAAKLAKELGFENFKQMASNVSAYAMKNAEEFFAESFALYSDEDKFDKLPTQSQELIYAAMKKMYLKQGAAKDTQVDFAKLAGDTVTLMQNLDKKKFSETNAATAGFFHAVGFVDLSTISDDDLNDHLINFMDLMSNDKALEDAFYAYSIDSSNMGLDSSKKIFKKADKFFTPSEVEKLYNMYAKAGGKQVVYANATVAAKPASLITDTDKDNFAKAKKMWDDKLAKDGKMGFGTLKTSLAQVFGLDLKDTNDEAKFKPIWDALKAEAEPNGLAGFLDIEKFVKPMFEQGKVEDLLAFDASHPVGKAKVEADAIAQAKAAAEAQKKAQAKAAAAQNLTGHSGYMMGAGRMTQAEADAFVDEVAKGHVSSSSSAGAAQKVRLSEKQKAFIKARFGVSGNIRTSAKELQTQIAVAIKNGDEATLKKLAPLYALHDYSVASGVYTWQKRGVNRSKSVSTSDHPLGSLPGLGTEYDYGQVMGKYLEQYFDEMPAIEEDAYVHRYFGLGDGRDTLVNLFGLESDNAKQAVEVENLIAYAKKHPGETIIRDRSFMSTSLFTDGTWNGNNEIMIKVTKGTKAAYLGDIEAHSGTNEILLKANQRMRVNAIYERSDYSASEWEKLAREKGFNSSKNRIIYAETIPDDVIEATIDAKVAEINRQIADSGSSRTLKSSVTKEESTNFKLLDKSEADAIRKYTGSSYYEMNRHLRHGEDVDTSYKTAIKKAKAGLAKVRTTEDRVYRRD